MNKEILSFYNLETIPFTKEIDPVDFVDFPSYDYAYKLLLSLIETRGIGVLIGKSGSGKSCLIRKIFCGLNKGLYKPIYICHSSVSLEEFYFHLAMCLGVDPVGRKAVKFRKIKDRILALNKNSKIHPVLVIDEADRLRNDILQDLRLLLNYEIDSFNALTVLLCGQPSLEHKFSLSILEPLVNSITYSAYLDGLKEEETYSYIENRISKTGNNPTIFTKNAMKQIHNASGGILRTINNISNSSLIKAFQMKSQNVEADHVNMVIAR